MLTPSSAGSWAGPQVRTGCESRVIPLLQGRVHAGHITAEPYAPPISGTVLEVGAGTGTWVSVYAGFVGRSPRGGGPAVTRVLGVEPNAASQVALREAVAASGLEGVYEPVPCGIEHLAATGAVERGSVDCIVVNLVLCGIPEPQHNIKELYSYLKPGGRIYVHEHVAVNRGVAMWLYQGPSSLDRFSVPPLLLGSRHNPRKQSHHVSMLIAFRCRKLL